MKRWAFILVLAAYAAGQAWALVVSLPDAVDAGTLTWSTGGDTNWFGQTSVTHDGVDAAQSGVITHSQTNWLQTQVTGPGAISFWWKVSSERGYDYLALFIDGVAQTGAISGEVSWQQQMFALGAGPHSIRWAYRKDNSVVSGADCGWVDQAVWTTGTLNTVTFDAGGGMVIPASKSVVSGSVYGQLPVAQYAGYAFAGWYTGAGGTGTHVTEVSSVTAIGSHTLYARWAAPKTLAEALDTTGLTWAAGGSTNWVTALAGSHDGVDVAQSGYIGNSQTNWVETTVTGPGRLSFWWKVSSQLGGDYLRFYMDGISLNAISGEGEWRNNSFNIDWGVHTLRWAYVKNGSVSTGSDCGWLDQVDWELYPTITVTFDSRGGTAVAPVGVIVGDYYDEFDIPVYAGKVFAGWWTAPNGGGVRVMPDTQVTTTVDQTLYAFWVTPVPLDVALETATLAWSTGGDAEWAGVPVYSHDGVDVAQSGYMGNYQTNWLQTEVTGPGALSFWWKVSSQQGNDYLIFQIDGVLQQWISGKPDWSQLVFTLGAGPHTLRWAYIKTSDWSEGADCGWVDQVIWTAGTLNTASFDASGGTVDPVSTIVVYGAIYGPLPTPELAGYAFAGWWTEPGGTGTRVAEDSTVMATGNHTLYAKWVVPPTFAEALDTAGLTWTTGGATNWWTQVMVTHDTVDAAQGGSIANSLQTWLETTVTGPGQVSFWWKVSSEAGWDYLAFSAGGVLQVRISGETGWQQQTVAVGSGTHTLRWTYMKDSSASDGSDCGWLDQVVWTPTPPPEPYVCSPSGDAMLTTAGSFDGYFYAASEFGDGAASAVRGTLTLKITDAEHGKLTAKAVLQKGPLTFNATVWTGMEADGSLHATLIAKGRETLELYVRQDRVWGTLSGGTLGGETFTLDGARNRFGDRKDAAAQALLGGFKGYYTVALPVAAALSLGAAEAAPQGSGYLAVTVGSGGSAKIAGVLADGTKVSQASRLILFDGCGPEACVPFFLPLYVKQGWAGGLLWLSPGRGAVATDRDLGWYVRWEKPGAGPDGFSVLLDADGGYYGSSAALAAGYLFTAEAGGVPFYTGAGFADAVSAALPEGIAVSGSKLTMVKGVKPVAVEGVYDYSGVNSSLATLTFTSGTGLFKGKFNLYYDYTLSGKLTHKVVSVPYAGVLTPVRAVAFEGDPAGQGHCLVPDNDPAVSAYKLKRSRPVRLESAP